MLQKEIIDYCVGRLKELNEFEKTFFYETSSSCGKGATTCYGNEDSYSLFRKQTNEDRQLIFSIFKKIIDDEEIQKIQNEINLLKKQKNKKRKKK